MADGGRPKAPPGTYWRGNTLWGRLVVDGAERRWSLGTSDAAVALSRREAFRQRAVAAARFGDQRHTWDDAVMAWTDHIAGNVSPTTITRYTVSIRQVNPFLKGAYLDEIDKAVISDLVRRRKRAGASNATIRRDLVAVSSVFDFAEGEGWVPGNPALARMRRLKERREPIMLPDLADVQAVIRRAPGLLAALTEAALRTGCRQAELVGLQRNRLDFARRQITIVGKGRKLRVIDMGEAEATFRAAPVHVKAKHVFWHDDGLPYANVSSRFREIVLSAQKAAQAAGREFHPFRFHDLRHRFAVDFLKNRVGSIYDLQQHLGHSSVKVTELYLAYLTPEEARAAKVGAHFPAHLQRSDAVETA